MSLFKKIAPPEPKKDETWKSTYETTRSGTFPLEKLKVMTDSEGNLTVDINGYFLTIPAQARHAFLEKIQRAVMAADAIDPNNEPLMRGMNAAEPMKKDTVP